MTRQTHDRTRDHRGTESSEWITLSTAMAGLGVGDTLDSLLAFLTQNLQANHLEVVMFDFGAGLVPVTDASGDWLYGHYQEPVVAGYHLEVAMYDFGTGLEPVTDASGDWLVGNYLGV